MNIDILCAGKLKEKYWRDAIAEYSKRLSRYCRLRIIEVADGPDMAHEAERMMPKIADDAYVISLEIKGKMLDSVALSQKIEQLGISGCSHIQFVIGGSDGIDPSVSKRADMHLSFSEMTFPHQLMRVILLEQIYRSYRIIHKEPYHK
ncbi:23S rRNA (pseudouridine1915-N3)-methyltransferase [Lachnospiraceae bacterium]|nr:23S rRNA (pseudouridine1915-N3)-methyltransferase [Lachnospiraceae bacterium]